MSDSTMLMLIYVRQRSDVFYDDVTFSLLSIAIPMLLAGLISVLDLAPPLSCHWLVV